MNKKVILSIFILAAYLISANAQNTSFSTWGAGINVGLYGFGAQGATSLSPNVKLRAGFDYFNYNEKEVKEFDVNVEYRDYKGTAKAELTNTRLTLPNFKTMIDYYPLEYGIFSLTGGFYFGNNRATANGLIRDYEELMDLFKQMNPGEEINPELVYKDLIISPNRDGSFNGSLGMGDFFKPYLGIGLGRTIPRNRIGFKFELGVVYQGEYTLSSPNIIETGNNWLDSLTDELNLPVSEKILNWWPMINLSLTYRIK